MARLPDAALQDIQGIILSGYAHLNYASFLFFRVTDPPKARVWLTKLIPLVRNAERWPVRADGRREKPGRAVQIAFTFTGLTALQLPEETLLSFQREFISGMPERAARLGDTDMSAPEQWELGGPMTGEIHGVVMIYEDDQPSLDVAVGEHRALMQEAGGAETTTQQSGWRPDNQHNPFGFLDGISQPDVDGGLHIPHTASPQRVVSTGEFILGYPNAYAIYPPSPAIPVASDPQAILPRFPDSAMPESRDFGHNGSYLVYRKLETDVVGFWRYVEEQAAEPTSGRTLQGEMAWLAAKLVGRWPSGAPLVLSPERDDPSLAMANDFVYAGDPAGFSCPIGSHIRRTNPRDALSHDSPDESFKSADRHRIIRRAVYYGETPESPDATSPGSAPIGLRDDGKPRGLHFFAINSDISRQFEFVQQTWSNQPTFNGLWDNRDPIIGDNDGTETSRMVIQREPVRKEIGNLPRFVQVRGGSYFFLPSLTTLRYLAGR